MAGMSKHHAKRNAEIVALFRRGVTAKELAHRHRITDTRVRQIVAASDERSPFERATEEYFERQGVRFLENHRSLAALFKTTREAMLDAIANAPSPAKRAELAVLYREIVGCQRQVPCDDCEASVAEDALQGVEVPSGT